MHALSTFTEKKLRLYVRSASIKSVFSMQVYLRTAALCAYAPNNAPVLIMLEYHMCTSAWCMASEIWAVNDWVWLTRWTFGLLVVLNTSHSTAMATGSLQEGREWRHSVWGHPLRCTLWRSSIFLSWSLQWEGGGDQVVTPVTHCTHSRVNGCLEGAWPALDHWSLLVVS